MNTDGNNSGSLKMKRGNSFLIARVLRHLKNYNFIAFICVLLLSQSLKAKEGINGNLVNADWLNEHLHDTSVIILDASPAKIYKSKHIPGAINVDLFTYGSQETRTNEIEKLYQSWGISLDKKIIIYDQGGTIFATRQFFSLYYFGFPSENLFVLDGGLTKWEEKNYPVTQDVTILPEHGTFKIKKINEDAKAELPEFLTASGDTKNNVLIEALGADWHYGEICVFDKAGHIPNAILIPSPDFFNPDKTFKSTQDIKKMLDYFKIKSNQNIYSHCGGGISASVPFFAVKFILHYPSVKLYAGSEIDWLADERELPYWSYDEPYLLRETNWLQFWGGKILRMYGKSNISIIDIRSSEEFYKGHVPFALNIPADVFKSNINNFNKLSELLGQSGVNQSHEAVIISGAGITKDAALVFLLLEKLDQKKVSIFIDSMDKWTQLGFPLTKDTTVVGIKNTLQDVSISLNNYSLNPKQGIIITDLKSARGIYPKALIASGINLPETDDSNVVHLQYSDLLNSDGTPKEAKDLWNVLDKAGVPRYAELVCTSDDPGEAAVNYFILKLMGYPDIKVLIN
jgi:thiosulfate/3-mercaptopyruvate sulfurtransferase